MIKAILTRHGHTVIDVEDGQRALDVLTEEQVDLILSDLKMPNLDGIALLEEIKKRDIAVPFVLLSAYVDDGEHAASEGVHYFLPKPFGYADLMQIVKSLSKPADAS